MISSLRLRLAIKRAVDVVGAACGLVVLSPLLLALSIVVLLVDGRPILFRSRRAGLRGSPFTVLKFRTMRPARRGEVWYATDARRLTRLGRILRLTSLDELPELWNVLRGEMSLVGPRPLLIEYLGGYTAEEARRHEMRPGITGWAAVHGRHAMPFADRLKLDVWYVDHWSLFLDLRIVLRTIPQVLQRSDVQPTQGFVEVGFPARFENGLAEAAKTDTEPERTD